MRSLNHHTRKYYYSEIQLWNRLEGLLGNVFPKETLSTLSNLVGRLLLEVHGHVVAIELKYVWHTLFGETLCSIVSIEVLHREVIIG